MGQKFEINDFGEIVREQQSGGMKNKGWMWVSLVLFIVFCLTAWRLYIVSDQLNYWLNSYYSIQNDLATKDMECSELQDELHKKECMIDSLSY